MAIDWEKCFICQNSTRENVSSTAARLATLSTLLPKFSEVNALEFDLEKVYTNGTSLIQNLKQNNAVYHRLCYKKHYQQKLEQAITKFNKISHKTDNVEIDISSAPVKRRSMASKHDVSKKGICCFCKQNDDNINLRAAGTLHATQSKTDIEHVRNLTEKWLVMAKTLNDDELIHRLSSGDVVSNELFYHKEEVKCCLAKYHKLYLQRKKEMGDSSVNKFGDEW